MQGPLVFRILFIIYCLEAGLLLALLPWTQIWDRIVLGLPIVELRHLGLEPLARGTVTGFGLVHLVWVVHDIAGWRRDRRRSGR